MNRASQISNLKLVTSGTALTQLSDTTHKLPLSWIQMWQLQKIKIIYAVHTTSDSDFEAFVDIFIYSVTDNKCLWVPVLIYCFTSYRRQCAKSHLHGLPPLWLIQSIKQLCLYYYYLFILLCAFPAVHDFY